VGLAVMLPFVKLLCTLVLVREIRQMHNVMNVDVVEM